jgi:hypothetical protein
MLAVVTTIGACGSGSATEEPAGSAASSAKPTKRSFALRVGTNRLVKGPRVIRVNEGDTVEFRLQSTRPVEETLIVKGYGQRGELDSADGTLSLVWVADRAGSFPIVKEENGARLATLVVT